MFHQWIWQSSAQHRTHPKPVLLRPQIIQELKELPTKKWISPILYTTQCPDKQVVPLHKRGAFYLCSTRWIWQSSAQHHTHPKACLAASTTYTRAQELPTKKWISPILYTTQCPDKQVVPLHKRGAFYLCSTDEPHRAQPSTVLIQSLFSCIHNFRVALWRQT